MQDFKERWDNEPKFKVKVKLSLYTLFVVLVSIYAISSRNNIPTTELQDEPNLDNEIIKEETITAIEIPEEYNYIIDVTINENSYNYSGTKNMEKETISKNIDSITTNYIYENDNYYKEENGQYILTTKNEVYDIVDYNYLKLDTINEYLSKSIKENDQYLVYLKDIILGNDSEEYITINLQEKEIIVDYTKLIANFDNAISKYLVNIKIEEL